MWLHKVSYMLILLCVAASQKEETRATASGPQIGSTDSGELGRTTRHEKLQRKWFAPTYRGLILGKTDRAQAEKILGKPIWSGQPEGPSYDTSDVKELWYEYKNANGKSERLSVVINSKEVVVGVMVYPYKLSLDEALRRYGREYIERDRRLGPCPTDQEVRKFKPSDLRNYRFYPISLVYPEKGMYLMVQEDDTIQFIGYLSRCP